MVKYLEYLVFLGAAVNLLGALSYVKATISGQAKPNRVSFLMWFIAPTIATIAAISEGVGWAVLPVFMSGFGPFLVLLASFINKNSYWKLYKLDYICGLLSLLALVFWWITKEANIAIIFAIASDGIAAIPTLIKSWKHPETESVAIYTGGLFNASTSFFAIKIWNFSGLAFPIYLVIIDLMLILAVLQKKILKKDRAISNV